MTEYKLYAGRPTPDGIEQAAAERFSRITPTYLLVYTCGQPAEFWKEVPNTEMRRLTREDARWLYDCGMALVAEEAEKNHSEMVDRLTKTIDRLEEELATAATMEMTEGRGEDK